MRRALGRGLEALLPGSGAPRSLAPEPLRTLPTDQIRTNPAQPRRHFAEEALAGLAESIRLHGLLQPVVVRPTEDGYELIAGERRLRAAQRAGLTEVPVVIRDAAPGESLELALIENLQREDLTPLEEAEAYRHLIDEYGLTQEEIARRVGKARPTVTNALRLLGLPDLVKARLEAGEITVGHARAVLAIEGGKAAQEAFAREITEKKLGKVETERLVAARRSGPAKTGRPAWHPTPDLHWRALGEELTRALGTRVRIAPRQPRGGAIEIEFYSDAELASLVDRLRAAAR